MTKDYLCSINQKDRAFCYVLQAMENRHGRHESPTLQSSGNALSESVDADVTGTEQRSARFRRGECPS